MPYYFTQDLFQTFQHKKYVKGDQDEPRYTPLYLQMCIGSREKCKFPIVPNCWKIDYVEGIFGVQGELHVEKKIVCNNAMKFLDKGNGVHWGQSDTLTLDMIDKSTDMFTAHCDCNNKGGGVALIVNTNLNPMQIRMNTILEIVVVEISEPSQMIVI